MKKGLIGLLMGGLAVTLFSCMPYKETVMDIAKKRGYTEEQAEVIYHGVLVNEMMVKNEDGTRKINYNWISTKRILEQIESTKDDLDGFLSYKNKGFAKIVDDFPGMRESLEKSRRVAQFIEDTLRSHHLYSKFKGLKAGSYYDEESDKFDLKLLDPRQDLEKSLSFTSKYVEEAKKQGTLDLVENFRLEFDYKEKNPDPNHPEDTNKFIFENKRKAIVVKIFDSNGDNIGDYAELFRIKENNSLESKPALKMFNTLNNETLNLAIIDEDCEKDSNGYGMPDFVETIYGIQKDQIALQISSNEKLMGRLFGSSTKSKKPVVKQNEAFIVEAGKVNIPEYEFSENSEGWKIPLEYRDKKEGNYTLKIKFVEANGKGKQIEYILKEWHNPNSETIPVRGRVIEYYKVKPEFSKNNILNISILDKKISMDLEGELTKTAFDNFFLQEQPTAIEYTFGNNRFRIIDLDNKPGYEARKIIADVNKTSSNNNSRRGGYGDDYLGR